jgi:CHAT domain-containing protein/tetratricopeptide (TPR) repeat protein
MRDHALRVRWRGALTIGLSILIGSPWTRVPTTQAAAIHRQQQDPRLDEAARLIEEAQALRKDGKLRDGVAAAEKAVTLVEQVRGADHLDTATVLMELGGLQFAGASYASAARSFERALAIREKALPSDDPAVAASLNGLANAYRGVGEAAKALPLFERSLEIQRKRLGEDNPATFVAMHNLGDFYASLGDYVHAQPLVERSVALAEKTLKPEDLDLAIFLNTLGRLYMSMGQFERAEVPLTRSLAIREKVLKPDHPDIARILGVLGAMYQERADLARAEANHRRALGIYERSLPPNDARIASTLHNLGVLCGLKRDYDEGEKYLQRALDIRRASLGNRNVNVATTLEALTIMHWLRGDAVNALRTEREADDIQDRQLVNILTIGSEQQKFRFMEALRENTDITLTLRGAFSDPDLDELAATTILRRKGRVLDAMVDTMAAIRRSASEADRAVLTQLADTRSELARLSLQPPYGMPLADRQRRLETLDRETQTIESRLSQQAAAVRAASSTLMLSDVTSRVPDDSILVEFVQYRPFDLHVIGNAGRFKAPRYMALILRRGAPPSWIDLGDTDQIDKAIAAWRIALGHPDRTDVGDLGRRVDKLVFEPLDAAVRGSRRILVAPDGALSLVPFGALTGPDGKYRLEAFEIVLLSTGRDLLRLNPAATSKTTTVIFANPAFTSGGAAATTNGSSAAAFEPLPSTAEEARALARLIPKAELVTGADASEARLKAMRAPGLLHIATHGFFSGSDDQPRAAAPNQSATPPQPSARASDALVRSGLALAGANDARTQSTDDGLLTAVEAASLDLSGTALVVLSACDTGMGEVRTGEGVQGLRRAFAMAGASSQVMSLWQVSDEATRELMVGFYRALIAGKGRAAALREVQLSMRHRADRAHPFYWAAFVFAGDWGAIRGL